MTMAEEEEVSVWRVTDSRRVPTLGHVGVSANVVGVVKTKVMTAI
jgi:hypothetical protein